jgi:hypothetical protein
MLVACILEFENFMGKFEFELIFMGLERNFFPEVFPAEANFSSFWGRGFWSKEKTNPPSRVLVQSSKSSLDTAPLETSGTINQAPKARP